MSAYTVDINAYVALEFAAPDYTANTRFQMEALMEDVAAEVVPESPADQQIIYISEKIENTEYFAQVPVGSEYYEKIQLACEYAHNLAVTANAPPGSGAIQLFSKFGQVGTDAPEFDFVPSPNTMGELPVFEYNGVGDYDLNYATTTPFIVANKTSIQFANVPAGVTVNYQITAPNQLRILTYKETADILTGAITGVLTNGLIGNIEILITIYP